MSQWLKNSLGHILSAVVDPSIFLSFDKNGYRIHSLYYNPRDLEVSLAGKICLVTGANSGIGFETARELAKKSAHVYLLCRNQNKGEKALQRIKRTHPSAKLSLSTIDIAQPNSIKTFVERFPESKLDILINNAGVLPDDKILSFDDVELTLATNLIGPFILTTTLLPKLQRSDDARIINVSSGGMYTQRLNFDKLRSLNGPFDGVLAYAQTKRALVIITEIMAEKYRPKGIKFNAMHPGWAATPGVIKSLPRFYRLMKGRLRNASEGADTVIWLACARQLKDQSGRFWFDRVARKTHYLPWTRETQQDRDTLLTFCNSFL